MARQVPDPTRLTRVRPRRGARWVSGVVFLTVLGCAERTRSPGTVESLSLRPTDTLITTNSEMIGGVYDLTVSPDGDVYVADYGFKHVLAVAPDGTLRRTIGREGAGPGEFQMPYVVRASRDSVWVFDAGGDRVQVFDTAGAVARSYALDAPTLGGGRDFREDGWLAATIGGFEGALIIVLDGAGARVATFGEPLAPPATYFDFTTLKAEMRQGRLPNAFRNSAMLAWGPDASLYLVFLAEPQVRRYDANDSLLWTVTLNEPVLQSIRDVWVRKNVEEKNPSRLYRLQYVTDLAVVDGDLWILLNTADEQDGLVLVLGAGDGVVRRRIVFPGLPNTGFIAVDEARRRVYMAPRGEGSVVIFELPGR